MPGTVLGARDLLMKKTCSLPSRSSDHAGAGPFTFLGYFLLGPQIHAPLINYLAIWEPSLWHSSPDGGFTGQDYLGVIFSQPPPFPALT